MPHVASDARPTSVLWAAIVTWVAAGLTAVSLGFGALVLATTVATVFLLIRRRQNPN